jgi:hypothetical protein|nr:hypothetical protein [uncultured Mediterranean phage uvMED]BAR38271.1 hypothetical protein [uncultured Mediterranean phage uvMED]|tara:strand:- start:240 stop:623 length:384 start_codon:yes stop_codon:yes gene_type:complete
MYNQLNQKLSEIKSGNYLIQVTNISDKRPNKYYSKEYFVTVTYQVTDLNNTKRKFGVIVAGMGAKPIELNVNRELHPTNYFTWESFDETLFQRLSKTQKEINEDGYYPKDRTTGQIVDKNNNLKGDQ